MQQEEIEELSASCVKLQHENAWSNIRKVLLDRMVGMSSAHEAITATLHSVQQCLLQPSCALVPIIILAQQASFLPDNTPAHISQNFTRIASALYKYIAMNCNTDGNSSSGNGGSDPMCPCFAQVEYAFKDLIIVSSKATHLLCLQGRPQEAIRPLMRLVRCISHFHPYTLTPQHSNLLQLLTASSSYTIASKFLQSIEISQINTDTLPISTVDYLTFFYLCGLVHINTKNYDAALDSLLTVLTTPAEICSTVMLQALKQAKLVSLISTGSPLKLPKYTSMVMKNLAKAPSPLYDKIDSCYSQRDCPALAAAINTNAATDSLRMDSTYGLAQHCLVACYDTKLSELTNTYMTLSMKDIAAACIASSSDTVHPVPSPSDTHSVEQALLRLIKCGGIQAKIDQQGCMAHFYDPNDSADKSCSDSSNVQNFTSDMDRFIEETINASNLLRDLRKNVMCTKEYVTRVNFGKTSLRGVGVDLPPDWDEEIL